MIKLKIDFFVMVEMWCRLMIANTLNTLSLRVINPDILGNIVMGVVLALWVIIPAIKLKKINYDEIEPRF